MKETSALYKRIRASEGSWFEIQVRLGGSTYGNAEITTLKIYPALFSEDNLAPVIGGTNSAKCELCLKASSSEWPRRAEFSVHVRAVSADGTQQSEWLSMGSFYTDERTENRYGDLSIVAYDAMLLTEQTWADKIPSASLPANWPITARAWCDMLAAQGLITVDSRSQIDDTVAFIGLDTTSTIRDKLHDIAAAHGGNWVMTPENKLRLIPFANMADGSAAIAGIALVGITQAGDSSLSNSEYVFLGMNVMNFTSSPALPAVSKASLESENGTVIESGTGTGYTIKGSCEFSSTEGVAALCLSRTSGYIYKPFSAQGAILDPAADPGDLVIIEGRSYQVMSIEWNLGKRPMASISAPYEAEVDHEYTVLSPEAKTYRKALAATDEKLKDYPTTLQMESAIQQSESSITLSVSQHYVSIEDYNDAIENLQDQIDGSISSFSGPDVPTLNNYPANDWTTTSEKQQHVGALYLVTTDSQSGQAGQYYRFEQSGNVFAWVLVEDSALATALANAAAAQAAAAQAQADADAAQAAADAAQGTADQAQAEAVAQAAQAKALAVTQAAADATAKANAALAEAKAYAADQVESFILGEYADDLAGIRGELGQKIETYYQTADPSLSWTTPSEHTGDLWYNTTTELYYRWSGTAWEELTSNPPQGVFDKIDGKANVFVSQPTPPYNVGDLWTQGENGDILRCKVSRAENEQYSRSDWELASKYTDDSALAQFLRGEFVETINALKKQLDSKAETFYQATDPSSGGHTWDTIAGRAIVGLSIAGSTLDLHVGDMWYRTTDDKTFRWNGTEWEEQTISREMFDTIDGKAQIFVGSNNPTPPYARGDLWFIDETSEILTCVVGKEAGQAFNRTDWEKRNKYTDDTYAQNVEIDLHANYYTKVETDSEINQKADEITLSVTSNVISENELTLPYGGTYAAGRSYEFDSSLTMQIQPDGTIVLNGISSETRTIYLASRDERLPLRIGTFTCGGNAETEEVVSLRVYHYNSENNTTTAIGDWFDAASSHTFGWGWPLEYMLLAMRIPASYEFTDFTIKPQIEYGRVLHGWQPPAMSTKSQIKLNSDHIYATVLSKSGGQQQSFGWTLTDSDWSLYSGNNRVFRASSSGIDIVGNGTFTGTVNATGGTFTGSITAHDMNIDGGSINLGNGSFIVTSQGAVTASNLSITGGSISIGENGGSPVFSVSSSGVLTATAGTFSGNLQGAGGTFSGNLNAAGGSFTGELRAATGTFAGNLQAAGGSFGGELRAATGTFSGNLQAAGGTFTGTLSAAGGTFSGDISGASGTFKGGLNIGNGKFVVDSQGNLTATSGSFSGTVLAKNIQAGGNAGYIQGSMIQTSTITGSLIAPTTITGANIQSGTITGSKIDSGTITGSNIQQSTITGSLIAPKTIGAAQITDKSIQAELIADGSITTELIEEECITTELIAEEAITEALLGDGAVSNVKIQTSTITGSKIAPATIAGTNIQESTITGGAGGNIASHTITGGSGGNLQQSTIKEFNVPGGEFSGSSLSSGVNTSLSYANGYNAATQSGTSSYPAYFTAGRLISMSSVIADEMQIRSSASGEAGTTLSNHYHTIITNADGTITFGMPYNSSTPPSFKIADTKAYKDGVSAVKATSIDFTLTLSDDGTYYKVTADAKNQAGTVVKTSEVNTNRQPYINGQTAAKTQYEPTSIDFTQTLSGDGTYYSITADAKNQGGDTVKTADVNTARQPYINGQANGRADYEPTTMEFSQTLSDDGTYYTVTATAKNQAGTAVKTADVNTARQPYLNGQDIGAASATVSACSLSAATGLNYDSEARKWYATSTATITPRATYSDGERNNPNVEMTSRTIDVTDVYNAGKGSATISDILEDTSRQKQYSNKRMNIPVKATLATGGQPFEDTLENVDVSAAWSDGKDAGAMSARVDGTSFDISSAPYGFNSSAGTAKVYVNARASATLGNGNTYLNDRPTLSRECTLDVSSIYGAGTSASQSTYEPTLITITPNVASNGQSYTLSAVATNRSGQTVCNVSTPASTDKTVYNNGRSAGWNSGGETARVNSISQSQYTYGMDDVDTSGRFKIYVTATAYPKYTDYNGNAVPLSGSSYAKSQRFTLDIHDLWAAAASDGIDAGVASVTVNQPNASGAPQYDEDEIRYSQYVTCTASNGKSNARTIYINAGTAYEHGYRIGYAEGQGSVSHSLWTSPSGGGQWNNANRRYEMTVYSCGGSFLVYSSNPFYRGDIW